MKKKIRLIEKKRERIPDVLAVYFVKETMENVDRIAKDLEDGLYDMVEVHFCGAAKKEVMERLARKCVEADCVRKVTKVFDQYAQFVSLQENLFTFNLNDAFVKLNRPITGPNSNEESELMILMENVVNSLVDVCVTLGVVPVIRAQRSGPAEHVAAKLDESLRSLLAQCATGGKFLFNSSASLNRPILILLDRTIDMSVCLHHTWTYQALIHDVLKMNANRVRLPASATAAAATIDIEPSDPFFSSLAALPFPAVASAVDTALKEYTKEMDKVSIKPESSNLYDCSCSSNSQ